MLLDIGHKVDLRPLTDPPKHRFGTTLGSIKLIRFVMDKYLDPGLKVSRRKLQNKFKGWFVSMKASPNGGPSWLSWIKDRLALELEPFLLKNLRALEKVYRIREDTPTKVGKYLNHLPALGKF